MKAMAPKESLRNVGSILQYPYAFCYWNTTRRANQSLLVLDRDELWMCSREQTLSIPLPSTTLTVFVSKLW